METARFSSWPKGSNNIDHPERLPDGFARSIINMDVVHGGRLELRPGYVPVYEGTPRGILALGQKLLIADAGNLVELDTRTGATRKLREISASGRFAGCVHNDRLFFCTSSEALEYDGTEVRPWGVQDAANLMPVSPMTGGLANAHYRLAITYTDQWGREGGTGAPLIYKAEGGIQVELPAPPAGHKVNLYVSSPSGEVLYLQHSSIAGGAYSVTRVSDDTRSLETINRYAPTPSDLAVSHNGVIAMARNGLVELTMPMRPHLVDRLRGFFQYPCEVGAMVSAGGLFVSADKSYVLIAAETGEVTQRVVAEYPAIAGTAVKLPNGSGSWVTERGYVRLQGESAEPVTESYFVPARAKSGASGVIDSQGSARIITTTKGQQGQNRLAAADHFDAEIKLP